MERNCGADAYENVLGVATDLFLRNGFDRTTIRMILDGCNIHSGSLYYLYSGKEEILKGVIEAFYGDIMCRSGRLSRSHENADMILILPAAFMLYSSSLSKDLARLLYQAHCVWPIMDKMTEMAVYWIGRDDVVGSDECKLRSDLQFLIGGIGNMIGECYHSENRPDHRAMIERFAKAAFRMMDVKPLEDKHGFMDLICKVVESEELEFFGRDIGMIDETYISDQKEE